MTRSARPEIAILINEMGMGGAETVMLQLVKRLCDAGIRVDVVVGNSRGARHGLVDKRARIVDLHLSRMHWGIREYLRYLEREKPERVLATIENAVVVALLASLVSRWKPTLIVRVANTLHREWGQRGYWAYVGWRMVARWLYKRADRVIAVSDGLADELVTSLGLDRAQVAAIPNPLDFDMIKRAVKRGKTQKMNSTWGSHYIVAVGRLAPQKDYSTLIRAYARSGLKERLVILGEGQDYNEIQKLIHELGFENRITLAGYRPDALDIVAGARMFVSASRHEGMSNALLEALGCGVACVSTDCPHGARQTLNGGRFGQLVKIGDIEGLAAAMNAVMKKHPLQGRQESWRRHVQTFELGSVVERYLAVMELRTRVRKTPAKTGAKTSAVAAP